MTTSSSTDITLLRLYPPQILGQTERVNGSADIGLSLTVSQLITDGSGAHVRIDPPISGTLNRGDVVFLWLVGEVAFLSFFTVVDPDAVIWMRLPNGRLDHARINEVFYTIERNSTNLATSEPPLKVLFNRFRPALKDRLTVPDGHSELTMVLSPELTNGVGPDFVKATVCFSYPYCRAHDVITLKCNGETIHFTVDESLAPQPPHPGLPEPITVCFEVDRAYLDKARRLDNKLEFRFTVKDQLGNTVDPDAIWSAGQTVDEDLAGTRLPRAILLEQMADFPGDDEKIIELEKLAGGPLNVIVVTTDKRFEAGDSIHFTYIAKIPGQADVVVTLTGTVVADAFGQKKPCIVQVENDKIPAGASVTVTYELRRPNGDLVGNSTPANATVTGAAPIQLTPVVLLAPATNPIDPLNNPKGVLLRATYPQALPGDKAQLVVPGAQTFPPVALNPNKQADFRLDEKFLGEWLGKEVKPFWQLIRDDKVIAESPPLELTISAIKPEDPRFPTPTITAVTDGETLNLRSFAGGTRMLVAPWRLIAVGQAFWAWCEGTDRNGATVTEQIHKGVPIGSTNNQGGPVSREFLDKLADGSTIRVYVAVNIDGAVNPATRVLFPVRSYTVKALEDVKPTIESAKDSKGGDIAQNGTTTDTTITLTGTASKGQSVKILDGTTDHGDAIADASSGVWTKTITGLSLKAHSFTAKALYGTEQISGAWALTVVSRLVVDTTPLLLNGLNISMGFTGNMWPRSGNDPTGTSATRAATGGVPPYTYESSDSSIASVDGKGTVRSEGNGLATIIAKDSSGQSITYNVTTSNVSTYLNGGPILCDNFDSWVRSVGGKVIPKSTLDTHIPILNIKYAPGPPNPSGAITFVYHKFPGMGAGDTGANRS